MDEMKAFFETIREVEKLRSLALQAEKPQSAGEAVAEELPIEEQAYNTHLAQSALCYSQGLSF